MQRFWNYADQAEKVFMRNIYTLFMYGAVLLTGLACSKNDNRKTDGCYPGAPTGRVITDKKATVHISGGTVDPEYLVEEGTIDTKLIPCSPLAEEFRQNNLKVIISGEVKATPYKSGQPCCSYSFVITKIEKQ